MGIDEDHDIVVSYPSGNRYMPKTNIYLKYLLIMRFYQDLTDMYLPLRPFKILKLISNVTMQES